MLVLRVVLFHWVGCFVWGLGRLVWTPRLVWFLPGFPAKHTVLRVLSAWLGRAGLLGCFFPFGWSFV